MTTLLELQGLQVDRSGRPILRGIDLAIPSGALVGLIGPNGAGKTTLLRAAAGLQPSRGRVAVSGRDLARIRPRERPRHFAYLPQEREIGWPLPVRAIVDLGRAALRRFGSAPSREDIDAVDRAIAACDIGHLEHRPASQLSGGERARTLIARALAQEAPLLLADEPVAGLDPAHRIALMQCLSALARDGGGVLVSLHDLGLAARWCDRIVVLNEGVLREDSEPVTALRESLLREVYGIQAHYARDQRGMIVVPTELALADDDAG